MSEVLKEVSRAIAEHMAALDPESGYIHGVIRAEDDNSLILLTTVGEFQLRIEVIK